MKRVVEWKSFVMQSRYFSLLVICFFFFSGNIFALTHNFEDKTVEINKNDAGKWDYEHVVINYTNGSIFKGHVDTKLNLIKGEYFDKNTESVYSGSFNENGQPDGAGIKKLKDGTVYDGHWIDGSFRGQGKKTCSDGSIIEGNFVSDELISGKDSYIKWTNGASYRGETVNGVFNGVGTYTFEDGSVYTGTFVDNKRTGFGTTVYDGSEYTGYYYGDVRTRNGDFKFHNGYEYKGNFFEGTFNGTGYLLVEEDEKLIYASDNWTDTQIPEDSKIIFEDGLVWEGKVKDGAPVLGMGIWTTQEERLAKLKEKNSYCELASYVIGDNTIIVASVYSPEEINQIIHSANYIRDFNNFYEAHKSTFEKVIKGMQAVAGVFAFIPSPIQPFAVAASIGLASIDISLKTMEVTFDIYDVIKAGNQSIIKDIALNYGKDIAWDVLDIILMGKPTNITLKGLEGVLTKAKISPEVVEKIINSSVNAGAVVTASVSALLAANTKMSETERQLRNLKRVKDLSEKGLIKQGKNLLMHLIYPTTQEKNMITI